MGTFAGLLGATQPYAAQVMEAYADAHGDMDDPAYAEKAYRRRQLHWVAPYAVSPATWYAAMKKAVPAYNDFNPKKVYDVLRKFPDARVWAAREGSVSLFVQGPLDNEPGGSPILTMLSKGKHALRADEVNIYPDGYKVKEYVGGFDYDDKGEYMGLDDRNFKIKGSIPGPVLRVWWD